MAQAGLRRGWGSAVAQHPPQRAPAHLPGWLVAREEVSTGGIPLDIGRLSINYFIFDTVCQQLRAGGALVARWWLAALRIPALVSRQTSERGLGLHSPLVT